MAAQRSDRSTATRQPIAKNCQFCKRQRDQISDIDKVNIVKRHTRDRDEEKFVADFDIAGMIRTTEQDFFAKFVAHVVVSSWGRISSSRGSGSFYASALSRRLPFLARQPLPLTKVVDRLFQISFDHFWTMLLAVTLETRQLLVRYFLRRQRGFGKGSVLGLTLTKTDLVTSCCARNLLLRLFAELGDIERLAIPKPHGRRRFVRYKDICSGHFGPALGSAPALFGTSFRESLSTRAYSLTESESRGDFH
jgi:hypothetical protein